MDILSRHLCTHCGKLLFKGLILSGNLEVKCSRCKSVNVFSGISVIDERKQYIFVCDAEGSIVDVNDSAIDILGYSREELLTMKLKDLYKNIPSPHYEFLRELKPFTVDAKVERKNGEPLPVHVQVKPLTEIGRALSLMIVDVVSGDPLT